MLRGSIIRDVTVCDMASRVCTWIDFLLLGANFAVSIFIIGGELFAIFCASALCYGTESYVLHTHECDASHRYAMSYTNKHKLYVTGLNRSWRDLFVYDMAYLCEASLMCMRHDVYWHLLVHMWHDAFRCDRTRSWVSHVRDMTLWHDSFISGMTRDAIHSFICDMVHSYVPWLIRACRACVTWRTMTHSCETWLVMCGASHSICVCV